MRHLSTLILTGTLAAGGAFPLAAAALTCADPAEPSGRVALSASSWGGTLAAIVLAPAR